MGLSAVLCLLPIIFKCDDLIGIGVNYRKRKKHIEEWHTRNIVINMITYWLKIEVEPFDWYVVQGCICDLCVLLCNHLYCDCCYSFSCRALLIGSVVTDTWFYGDIVHITHWCFKGDMQWFFKKLMKSSFLAAYCSINPSV